MYTQEQLIDFLLRAKRATYAGKGAETPAFRPGAHDLLYREEDLLYYDTYLGGDLFAGEEALWIRQIPFWSMNYTGRVTGDDFSGDFLKEALRHGTGAMPYRGPDIFTKDDFIHINVMSGGISRGFKAMKPLRFKATKFTNVTFTEESSTKAYRASVQQ